MKPRKPTIDNALQADSDADEEEAPGGHNDGEQDEDAPARGHYGIFVQTRKCEDLCLGLGLTLKHIRQMKKLYDANDMYCTYVVYLLDQLRQLVYMCVFELTMMWCVHTAARSRRQSSSS